MGKNIFEHTMVEMTWKEVEALAKQNAIVLLPLGVIEEHGYHLPLGTDIYLATSQAVDIAKEMEKEKEPCIIAPPYYWGTMQVVTKNFPGSFTTKPEHIAAMLTDLLESLEQAGFLRVVTTNAHGDGLHTKTIMKAFKEFNQTHKLQVRWLTFKDDVVNLYGLTGEEDFVLPLNPYPFEKMVEGLDDLKDSFDVHAGAIETACMLEAVPELIDLEIAKKQKPTMLEGEQIKQWLSGKEEYIPLTPEGHVGDPASFVKLKTNMEEANRVLAHGILSFYKEQNR